MNTEQARKLERDAIVAWLRGINMTGVAYCKLGRLRGAWAVFWKRRTSLNGATEFLADAIERGEHF